MATAGKAMCRWPLLLSCTSSMKAAGKRVAIRLSSSSSSLRFVVKNVTNKDTTTAVRFSSSSSSLRVDPSRLIQGLTSEKLEKNPDLEAYLRANFPEAFQAEEQQQQSEQSGFADLIASSKHDNDETSSEGGLNKEPKPVYPLNIRPLSCYLRDVDTEEGSRRSRRLRSQQKMIPGLLYGSDPNLGIFSHQPESKILIKTPWNLIQAELERYHRHFESRVYDLTLYESPDDTAEGTVHRVIPRNLQRHPVQHSIYCVNFCRYHPGRPIKIPITYINEEESIALKGDGFILPIQRYVECFVEDGVAIPERLELECTGLRFKDVIRTDRLIVPDGVRFSDRVQKRGRDFIVGVVFGKGRGVKDNDEPEEG